MPHLNKLPSPAAAVVIGASGGLGSALVRRLADEPGVSRVHALARTSPDASDPKVRPGTIDVTDESSIQKAAAAVREDGAPTLVIVATGILHDANGLAPEKRMQDMSRDAFDRVFAINAFGPALVAKHFLPLFARGERTVFAALSARVGSISDNRLGGWAAYRASKAALNMLLKTLAIEHARTRPESAVIGLHPGTVDTELSRPFQGNVPDGKLFTADRAAGHLLDVIDSVTSADSGNLFAWDGSRIEF